jgi:hypothetical protein
VAGPLTGATGPDGGGTAGPPEGGGTAPPAGGGTAGPPAGGGTLAGGGGPASAGAVWRAHVAQRLRRVSDVRCRSDFMRSLRPQRAEGYRTRGVRLGLEISTRELSPARAPGLLLTFIEASHITSGPLAAARASRRGFRLRAAKGWVENFAQSTDMGWVAGRGSRLAGRPCEVTDRCGLAIGRLRSGSARNGRGGLEDLWRSRRRRENSGAGPGDPRDLYYGLKRCVDRVRGVSGPMKGWIELYRVGSPGIEVRSGGAVGSMANCVGLHGDRTFGGCAASGVCNA